MKSGKTLLVFCSVLTVLVSCIQAASAAPAQKPWWIINTAALHSLENNGLPERISRYFFDNDHTFITQKRTQTRFAEWRALNTRTFTSVAALQKAFDNGTIDSDVKAILYDNEAWSFTPLEEQLNIAEYEKKAAALVHQHRLLLVSTPASDLVRTLSPNAGPGHKFDAFLRLGVAADAARVSDVYEIQAQGAEMNAEKFSTFVRGAAKQARQANPHVIILAGLSTNPTGQRVTADQLLTAAESVSDVVDGYWLNIPGKSPYCPTCGQPAGDVGAEFLQKFYERHNMR
jgi:hypothetical protein